MDSPFYRSHRSGTYPYSGYSYPQIPKTSQVLPSRKPKVISIPVHYISSDESKPKPELKRESLSLSGSAIRIQKAWRGFRVRHSVKKVLEIQRQVDEVEKKILDDSTAIMIRTDEREALKVSETLMAFLLELDSIRSVDGAVRDLRKAVIRRAILLQEKIDSMVSVVDQDENHDPRGDNTDGVDHNAEHVTTDSGVKGGEFGEALSQESNFGPEDDDDTAGGVQGEGREEDSENRLLRVENYVQKSGEIEALDHQAGEISSTHDPGLLHKPNSENQESMELARDGKLSEMKVDGSESYGSSISGNPTEGGEEPVLVQRIGEEKQVKQEEIVQLEQEEVEAEAPRPPSDVSVKRQRDGDWSGGEKSKRDKELLERMAEDNKKMMVLMADLFERNEAQTRILSSLSQRVDQLENAFLRDKSRESKKKRKTKAKSNAVDKFP